MARKIGKRTAEKIAKSGKITWGEIQATLRRAYEAGAANEDRAVVNQSFTKAASYNLMCDYTKDYDPELVVDGRRYSAWIGARHVLHEFGQFWQGWRPEPKKRRTLPKPSHQPAIEPPF
jgi:hypothetical protein